MPIFRLLPGFWIATGFNDFLARYYFANIGKE